MSYQIKIFSAIGCGQWKSVSRLLASLGGWCQCKCSEDVLAVFAQMKYNKQLTLK